MKLRKVKIKYSMKNDFNINGFFHEWGIESGCGNYTVGIVELLDGTVIKIEPEYIKFID